MNKNEEEDYRCSKKISAKATIQDVVPAKVAENSNLKKKNDVAVIIGRMSKNEEPRPRLISDFQNVKSRSKDKAETIAPGVVSIHDRKSLKLQKKRYKEFRDRYNSPITNPIPQPQPSFGNVSNIPINANTHVSNGEGHDSRQDREGNDIYIIPHAIPIDTVEVMGEVIPCV